MDFLHCNGGNCGDSPMFGGPKKKYFLTSCGHVLCEVCKRKGGGVICVCGTSCRFVELGDETKAEHRAFFMDPLDLLNQQMAPFIKIVKFQKTQAKNFSRIFGKLKEEVSLLKSEVDQLKAQKAELTAKVNELESREQNWIGHGSRCGGGLICSPATPLNNEHFFVQQPSGPLFGPSTSGGSSGFSGSESRTPVSFTPSPSTPRSGSDGNSRTTQPIAPTSNERVTRPFQPVERFTNRFSPAIGSSPGIGQKGDPIRSASRPSADMVVPNNSTSGFSRLSGLSFTRQQQQQQPSFAQSQRSESQNQRPPSRVGTTPDIMSRLKNLRW